MCAYRGLGVVGGVVSATFSQMVQHETSAWVCVKNEADVIK